MPRFVPKGPLASSRVAMDGAFRGQEPLRGYEANLLQDALSQRVRASTQTTRHAFWLLSVGEFGAVLKNGRIQVHRVGVAAGRRSDDRYLIAYLEQVCLEADAQHRVV